MNFAKSREGSFLLKVNAELTLSQFIFREKMNVYFLQAGRSDE